MQHQVTEVLNFENYVPLKFVKWEKSLQEGYGEVQEMIDICDFAVGFSRQLHGLTMHLNVLDIECMSNTIQWELGIISL
jgi:acyl-CoA reductase-like NAD-dependent aldehyde dehydrogenase